MEQLDDDRFQYYLKHETIYGEELAFEKVTWNRENKSITSEYFINKTSNPEHVYEKDVISAEDDTTVHDHYLYEDQGIKSFKIEMFKVTIEKILRAIKF